MNSYLGVMKKYVVFSGRASRKDYWMFFLFNFLIAFAIGFFAAFLGDLFRVKLNFLSTIYTLAIVIPSISVGVRRMHDTNRSGWWLIVPIAGLYFCSLVAILVKINMDLIPKQPPNLFVMVINWGRIPVTLHRACNNKIIALITRNQPCPPH